MAILLAMAIPVSAQEVPYGEEDAAQPDGIEDPAGEPSKAQQKGFRTVDILIPEPDQSLKEMPVEDDSEANMAIPVPINPIDENQSIGGQTFVDDVFMSPQNRWGFSLAAYQAFSNDISETDQPRQSSGITAFMPRTFFNFGKRKSRFHVDLGAGYRIYNKSRHRDSWDYSGNAQFMRELSNRTSLQVSNQFTSSFNDAWSFLSLYSPLEYDLLSSNEVLFNRQRINRNAFKADLDHRLTRKARFGLFGGYRWYEYPSRSLENSHALEGGGDFRYQLADWVYVSSSITAYLNLTDASQANARIYHIQFGGLDFHLNDFWRIWGGGGIDISDYNRRNEMREHVNAGIGYNSLKTSMELTYQRGFTSAIGISRLLSTDVFNASFGRRFTRWMSASLQAYYYKSNERDREGALKTFSGGGGLDFALRRDLSFSMSAAYQNQKARDFSVDGLGLSRLSAYAGLHYVWPARKQNEY